MPSDPAALARVLADSAVSRGVSNVVEVTSSGEGLEKPNLYVLHSLLPHVPYL